MKDAASTAQREQNQRQGLIVGSQTRSLPSRYSFQSSAAADVPIISKLRWRSRIVDIGRMSGNTSRMKSAQRRASPRPDGTTIIGVVVKVWASISMQCDTHGDAAMSSARMPEV